MKSVYYSCTLMAILAFTTLTISKNTPDLGYSAITPNVATASTDTAFDKMMQVLTHERCLNCHPTDNIPKQGNERRKHHFGIRRGEKNLGFAATQCNTCHQAENNNYSGVPGAPHWSLAPKSMGWQGLTKYEIARNMLDKTKNGNRSHEALVHHLTEDALVLWAFEPGMDHEGIPRETPPISEADYKAAVIEWFENGAIIPEN